MGPGGFGGQGIIGLLGLEQVQKDIQETPDQIAKIKEISDALNAGRRGQFQALRDLSEAERTAKMGELREKNRKDAAEAEKKVADILLAEQFARVQGIYCQVAGTRALTNLGIAKALKLTEDQQKKIAEIQTAAQGTNPFAAMREMQNLTPAERQEAMAKARDKAQQAQKDADEKVMAALTAGQKADLEKMKGKEFKLEMPARGAGGRRGGRGGGGAGGGPTT
jgi:Spy/CpxP family protein refolding chaperone